VENQVGNGVVFSERSVAQVQGSLNPVLLGIPNLSTRRKPEDQPKNNAILHTQESPSPQFAFASRFLEEITPKQRMNAQPYGLNFACPWLAFTLETF
jgi:hypothetical protein